jgi:hypothetical protein
LPAVVSLSVISHTGRQQLLMPFVSIGDTGLPVYFSQTAMLLLFMANLHVTAGSMIACHPRRTNLVLLQLECM